MGRFFIVAVLLAAVSISSGCAHLGSTYYKDSQEFSFNPPAGWRHNSLKSEITIFQSHHLSGRTHRPTMSIIVSETKIETLEEYTENQIELLEQLPEYNLVGEGSVGGFEARRFVYTFRNKEYDILLKAVTQIALHDGKVYVITFVAENTVWKKFRNLFYTSLDSFKFGKNSVSVGQKMGVYDNPELETE